MKKTALIEIFKNIRKTIVSFISIVIFVLLGTTIFQGLDFTTFSADRTVQNGISISNGYDIKITFGGLVEQADVDGLTEVEGVDRAEGIFYVCDEFTFQNKNYYASVQSLTQDISTVTVLEGTLPVGENEIAVMGMCATQLGLKVGDKITFQRDNRVGYCQTLLRDVQNRFSSYSLGKNDLKNFKNEEFTVTALVYSSFYQDHSTMTHGTDFESGMQVQANFFVNYSAFNPLIAADRYNRVVIRSNSLNGVYSFDKSYKTTVDALQDRVETHVENKINSKVDFKTLRSVFDIVKRFADDGVIHINNIIDMVKPLLPSGTEISVETLKNMISTICKDGDAISMDLLEDYLDKWETLEETKTMQTRLDSFVFTAMKILTGIIGNEKYSIGGIFLVISVVISFMVITRQVGNDVKYIGTKKALGFKSGEIIRTYLAYTLLATVLGLIGGNGLSLLLEYILIRAIMIREYSITYVFNVVDPVLIPILAVSMLVIIGLITFIACRKVIKKRATVLLQGDNAVSAKPVKASTHGEGKIFKRIPLIDKVILRNFKNDKKRAFATVMGVAFSVALLVSSLMFTNAIGTSFSNQYTKYFHYDSYVYMDANSSGAQETLQNYFSEKNIPATPVYREACAVEFAGNDAVGGYLVVYFDTAGFNQMVTMESANGNPTFANKGFWFPESYQEFLHLANETSMSLVTGKGQRFDAATTGFYHFYNYTPVMFVDEETYEEACGTPVTANAFMISTANYTLDQIQQDLKDTEGYLTVYNEYEITATDLKVFNLIATMLFIVMLISSLILALFVILNLLLSYVKEKKRELITLMINGYSTKTTYKYIYFDTIILSIVGLLVGSGIGLGLGNLTIFSFESKYMILMHLIDWGGIGIGIAITSAIVAAITIFVLRKIKHFKLKDIND